DGDSSREPYVEPVEHGSLLLRIHGSDHRVICGFHHTVCKADKERGEEERVKAVGQYGERYTKYVTCECNVPNPTGPEGVVQWSAHECGNRETENSHEVNPSELCVGEAHVLDQIVHDPGPDSKSKGCSEECKTTGDK